MDNATPSVTIYEQRHEAWKSGTCMAAALALLFGLLFWWASDPLWIGILRLTAFIFFSLAVFGTLKLLSDPFEVTLSSQSDKLLVDYKQKEEIVHKEQFDCSSIQKLVLSTREKPLWSRYLQPNTATVLINFNDNNQDVHLFEYSGRTLFFDESSLHEVFKFLKQQNVAVPHTDLS